MYAQISLTYRRFCVSRCCGRQKGLRSGSFDPWTIPKPSPQRFVLPQGPGDCCNKFPCSLLSVLFTFPEVWEGFIGRENRGKTHPAGKNISFRMCINQTSRAHQHIPAAKDNTGTLKSMPHDISCRRARTQARTQDGTNQCTQGNT